MTVWVTRCDGEHIAQGVYLSIEEAARAVAARYKGHRNEDEMNYVAIFEAFNNNSFRYFQPGGWWLEKHWMA